MKTITICLTLLLCGISCTDELLEKQAKGETAPCIKVSQLTGICGQAILQISDPEFFYLGEDWNGHKSVFFSWIPCDAPADLSQRSSFYVRILDQENLGNCMRCLAAIDYTGIKRYAIEVVETCGQ